MLAALGRLAGDETDDTPHTDAGSDGDVRPSSSRLSLVELGNCGRPVTGAVAALLPRFSELHTLRLRGCFRLATRHLVQLMERCGGRLHELWLSANSQVR